MKWFWAIFLIAHDKRGVSAAYLSEELGIAYQTAWAIQHKVRKAMGERDASYTLAVIVELDDVFFGAPTEGGKRYYRFNRREVKSELFNRLVQCCLLSKTITYPELVG